MKKKNKMLFEKFFLTTHANDHHTPQTSEFSPAAFKFIQITDEQIHRAITCTSSFKVPGANRIPNVVLKQCPYMLIPYIRLLFHSTSTLQVYPAQWKDSITHVLHKPGKQDYMVPGAYGPIALLDILGKILSSCVT